MTSLAAGLRERAAARPILGSLLLGRDPAIVEVYAAAGWDFVIADCEHGPVDNGVLLALQRAAEATGIALLVRLAVGDAGRLGALLDAGLAGVLLAQAEDGPALARAASLLRFAPSGRRSLNPFVRGARFGAADLGAFLRQQETADRPLLWTMAEGGDERATAGLLDVEGLDGVLVGPYDLSVALGHPGAVEHPAVEERIAAILREAGARGVLGGVFARSAEVAARHLGAGARMVTLGVDLDILRRQLVDVRESVEVLRRGYGP